MNFYLFFETPSQLDFIYITFIIISERRKFISSTLDQIRCEVEKLYESYGLTPEVLELSRQLDKEVNKIQRIIWAKKQLSE